MKIDLTQFGAAVREFREDAGLTQQNVADRLRVTTTFLSLVENGKRGMSGPLTDRLAEVLRVPAAILKLMGTVCDPRDDNVFCQLTRQLQKLTRQAIATSSTRRTQE